MATNSFLGFSEDGTELFEMKSKMARQVGNDVSASVKTSIRSTLGVPASAEGLTPANNLSDVSSAETSRANLDVMQVADVNDRALSKAPANGLDFDGTDDVVTVADNTLLEFGDASTDSPFSLSVKVKFPTAGVSEAVLGKCDSSAPDNEYLITKTASDTIRFEVYDSSLANYLRVETDAAITIGEWLDIVATYDGGGADTGMTLYINGVAVAQTQSNNAYTAMHAGAAGLYVGNTGSGFGELVATSAMVFNRELTAAQALRLSIEGTVEVSDQWAGAALTSGTLEVGQRYRLTDWITADDFTNVGAASNADGVEFVATGTTPTTWSNSSAVTPIGAVVDIDFQNADITNGVAPDKSSNGLNGTITGCTATAQQRGLHINAPSPAADEKLLSLSVAGTEKVSIDEDGTIRQEGLAVDAPVAKYVADAITTAGTVSHQIPIDIGGTIYYLVAHTHGS